MTNRMTRLARFSSKIEADLVAARLEAAGIGSRVEADDAGGAYPVLQGRGTRLFVRAEDAYRARQVLDEPVGAADLIDVKDSAEELAAAEASVRDRTNPQPSLLATPVAIALSLLLVYALIRMVLAA